MSKQFRILMRVTENPEMSLTEVGVKRVIKTLLGGHFTKINISDCDEVKSSDEENRDLRKIKTSKGEDRIVEVEREDPERFDGMS